MEIALNFFFLAETIKKILQVIMLIPFHTRFILIGNLNKFLNKKTSEMTGLSLLIVRLKFVVITFKM